ncbi:hypothetical protein BD769DRAFT_179156 [Suillus cothurnatus]|nr:hypothetical protein BD769DRAFT_179156 [Suillus cothurnatus]
MQTDSYYSANDVTTAKGLQFLMYTSLSMATFWIYDYVCSLHEELAFLLRSRWTIIKALYIITRYAPFLLLITDLYLYFTQNENPDKCRMVISIYSCLSIVSVACSEFFFVLRTYALWNNNRTVLTAMLSAFFAVAVTSIVVEVVTVNASHVTIGAIQGIRGCYRTSSVIKASITFILLSAFQLGLISLTLIRAVQSWRVVNGPLYDVLVKHNIFYYTFALLLSALNVLTQTLFSKIVYRLVCEVLQFYILAILATRMHLLLWQIDRQTHGSGSDTVYVTMSDMRPAERAFTTV